MIAASCGTDLLKKDDAKPKGQETGDVEFSGYVQKAFAIKVKRLICSIVNS